MILFLDFTPIEFMGGTEKWMNDTAKKISKYEDVQMLSVDAKIADLYGQAVVGRKYTMRVKESELHNHTSLDLYSFIPFTKKWGAARRIFAQARLIYIKFDVLEALIIIYFIGLSGFRKTVIGFLSPLIYHHPIKFFDSLHNYVSSSIFSRYLYKNSRKLHVINSKDKLLLESKFLLKNVVYVPMGAKLSILPKNVSNGKSLRILFIGELSPRKGIDILIEIIKKSPKYFHFDITSDGPFKEQISQLANSKENCTYHGYISDFEKKKLYYQSDVLILPSRGEGFPLVIRDALAYGLCIVDSGDIRLNLPDYVEFTSENNRAEEYIDILQKIYDKKQNSDFALIKRKIVTYCKNNLSEEVIFPRLINEVFSVERNLTQ